MTEFLKEPVTTKDKQTNSVNPVYPLPPPSPLIFIPRGMKTTITIGFTEQSKTMESPGDNAV